MAESIEKTGESRNGYLPACVLPIKLYTYNSITHTSTAYTGLSIEDLRDNSKVTDEQLDTAVEEADLPELAACFDNTEHYVEKLQLSPGQRSDVRTQMFMNGTQAGMKVALKHWRDRNPMEATFRALLLILLSLLKGDVALRVCIYLSDKCEHSNRCLLPGLITKKLLSIYHSF